MGVEAGLEPDTVVPAYRTCTCRKRKVVTLVCRKGRPNRTKQKKLISRVHIEIHVLDCLTHDLSVPWLLYGWCCVGV